MHAVDAGSIDAMSTGMRVAPRWKAERIGHITDIDAFVPGESAQTHDGGGAGEPVTMMEYDAEIAYRIPITPNVERAEAAGKQGRFLGLRCPICSRTYTGGRGFCPIDAIELTAEHEVDLPQTGVVTNYTIITPTQYPGQTATEPFSRVHVWLDDTDVVLGYQTLHRRAERGHPHRHAGQGDLGRDRNREPRQPARRGRPHRLPADRRARRHRP